MDQTKGATVIASSLHHPPIHAMPSLADLTTINLLYLAFARPQVSDQYVRCAYVTTHPQHSPIKCSMPQRQSRTNTSLIYQDHRYQNSQSLVHPIHILNRLERDGGTSLNDVNSDAAISFKRPKLTCFLSPPSSKCLVRFRTSWCLTLQTVHSRRRTTFLVCCA